MVQLSNHQLVAVEKLDNKKILVGGVGSGKSRTGLAYWCFKNCRGELPINGVGEVTPMKNPCNLYIITTARKRDSLEWNSEIAHFGFYEYIEDGKEFRIIIDSWNNIKKYKTVTNSFFIFDEQRLVGSGAWVKSFYEISKNNKWILLTATPGDTWSDYIPIFVAHGFYKNKTEFLNAHAVYSRYTKYPSITRYLGENHLERLRNSVVVIMDYSYSTKRHEKIVRVDHDRLAVKELFKTRWNKYKNKPIKNSSELFYLVRREINTHEERIEQVLKIIEERQRVIIFYNFDYELEILRSLSNKYLYAEWNGHIHEAVPEGDSWVYVVQYKSASEAWNCITTDTMIFYSLHYSWKTMEQSEGRIDRMNTPYTDLYYYVLISNSHLDLAIWRSLKSKKSFNERLFYKKFL